MAPRGFIALTSAVIISAILIALMFTTGTSGFFARANASEAEFKRVALGLAESCANQALLKVAENYNYAGNETVTIATDGQGRVETCKISAITYGTEDPITHQKLATIPASASYPAVNGAFSSIAISSLVQNPKYPAPARGTLNVIVNMLNDDGGTKQSGDFTVNATAVNPFPALFSGAGGSGTQVLMSAGPYSVSIQGQPADYTVSDNGHCSGTMTAGGIDTCIITENDIPTTAQLTVTVNVVNDNGGTKLPSDFQISLNGSAAISGVPNLGLTPGTYTASAAAAPAGYTASAWGTDCGPTGVISLVAGQKKTCTITFDDNPPAAPICADSVMILDRTGSMGSGPGSDLQNEGIAATGLTNLYASVTPAPKLSVGSIGAYPNQSLPAGAAGIYSLGHLGASFANLLTAVSQITGSNSSVGSNLAAGITAGQTELTTNGTKPQKVLIFVSDGEPNEPSGSTAGDTGFHAPTASSVDAGVGFLNPTNAYANGGGDALGTTTNSVNKERFFNFNFPIIPSNANITGIEMDADAWATTNSMVPGPTSAIKAPLGTLGSPNNQWGSAGNAFVSDNVYATDATNGHNEGYGTFGFAIPANATITGVQVTTEAKIIGFGAATQTGTLTPNGQGADTAWNGDESDVDETGAVSCASNDRIDSSTNNNRESVNIDLSSIPDGSNVTSIDVQSWDQGNSGGQYQAYVAVNGTRTNSGTITVTGTSNCAQRTTTITPASFTKINTTNLEVGVQKVGNTTVQVGALRAVIHYQSPVTGSLAIALSSNNGGTWTATKSTPVDVSESVDAPTGNTATDLWGRTWTQFDFNNGNFVLRVTNTSATGPTVSLDQVVVTVNYTVPVMAPVQCQLGMDISWNGGTTWTSPEKTQTVSNTEATYVLGASNDDWSGSHTWAPGEFVNGNFRARVHAIDPGINCDDLSVEHLDYLQGKVYYTIPADPTQATLDAADAAKIAGTQVFSIHFGSTSGRNLMAELASGVTPVAGHQPGSAFDQSATPQAGNTGFVQPTATAGPMQFTNPNNAYTSNNVYTTDVTNGHQQGYGTFGLVPAAGSTITGIEVSIEAKSSDSSGCQVGAELSTNNGTSYTTTGNVMNLTGSDSVVTLGSTANLWGRSWTPSDFADGKFVIRLQDIDPGINCTNGSTLSVDQVRVRVSYSTIPENADGDNFFISPTSADMANIFTTIGEKVCPAAIAPPAAPPPTQGILFIIGTVVNDNGGTNTIADFTGNVVTGTNATPTSFTMTGSPGVTVTLDPGSYSIDEAIGGLAYIKTLGPGCSGSINAGQFLTCSIVNDDIPPAISSGSAAPPPTNVIINTWQETP